MKSPFGPAMPAWHPAGDFMALLRANAQKNAPGYNSQGRINRGATLVHYPF